jgi:hypothetical protein
MKNKPAKKLKYFFAGFCMSGMSSYRVHPIKQQGFYDRERKNSRKKTDEYLVAIDESEGFVATKTKRVPKNYQRSLTHRKIFFFFEGQVIYYDSYPEENNRTVYFFIDEQMMIKGKRDFVMIIELKDGRYKTIRG